MTTVVIFLLLALIFGAIGLLMDALRWALLTALLLIFLAALAGFRARRLIPRADGPRGKPTA